MKLTVLCDNNTFIDNYLLGEPALSFFIENNDDKILFDLGYSNVYKQNAKKLSIDLSKVEAIAFSHGHDDHTKGLKYFDFNSKPTIYFCNGCFDKKMSDGIEISAPYSLDEMKKKFKMKQTDKPFEISENLFYLGHIPRVTDFEKANPNLLTFKGKEWIVDSFTDDTAMVYDGENGLTVITGCSHSGICNIISYAKSLFGKPVKQVIGGFHLLELNKDAEKAIKFLKKEKIEELYPCHCTGLHVKSEMIKQGLNEFDVWSGLVLEIK